MRDVYAHSYCTIAAAVSLNPTEDPFRSREIEDIRSGTVQTDWGAIDPNLGVLKIFERWGWSDEIARSPLHHRGWVLQERLLAPRVLHFTETQILWECDTTQKSEIFPQGILAFLGPPLGAYRRLTLWPDSTDTIKNGMMAPMVFGMWKAIVETYSECRLTYPSDKLVAISGLAVLFQELTEDIYLAGLWKSRLLDCLVWEVRWYVERISKPATYRAPSWSWASIDGPIFVPPTLEELSYVYLSSVLDAEVITMDNTPQGEVLSGFIVLRGPAVCCHLRLARENLKVTIALDDPTVVFEDADLLYFLVLKIHPMVPEEKELRAHNCRAGRVLGIVLQQMQSSVDKFIRRGSFNNQFWDSEDLERFGLCMDRDLHIMLKENAQCLIFKII